MPSKKTPQSTSILIDKMEFLKVEQASGEKNLEKHLIDLMKLANEKYDAVYLESKDNPDIEKFTSCKENFEKIKSIIKPNKSSTELINKFYFETWISMLYSDVHALNLEPETEDQLNELNEKIQAIGTDFKQLLTEKPSFNPKDESTIKLQKYIEDFGKNWNSKKNMLLGHTNYNFAETLVEKSEIKLEDKTTHLIYQRDAIKFFKKSADFYKQANLFEFKAQTEQRIKVLEVTSKELQNSSSNDLVKNPLKELVVVLRKLSPARETNGIKTESVWVASCKSALDKLPEVVDHSTFPQLVSKKTAQSNEIPQTRGSKRESSDNIFFKPAKKIKWEDACTQLLNEFEQIGINYKYYKLSDTNPSSQTLNKYKAILSIKHALSIIKNLMLSEENITKTEKQNRLKEVKNSVSYAIDYYSHAGLLKEKGKMIQYHDILTSTINGLFSKESIKHPNSSTNRGPSFTQPIVTNVESDVPSRDTRAFFTRLSRPENNVIKIIDTQSSCKKLV
jgi:hypothetical protein